MYLLGQNANTIIGKIDRRLLAEALKLAGIKTGRPINEDGFYEESLTAEHVEAWHRNSADERKQNERDLFKSKIPIPIRMYNFEAALMKAEKALEKLQDFHPYEVVKKAIEIFKSSYLDVANEPVYLPERLSDDGKDYTYGKLIEEINAERRAMFEAWGDKEKGAQGHGSEDKLRREHPPKRKTRNFESAQDVLSRIIPKTT